MAVAFSREEWIAYKKQPTEELTHALVLSHYEHAFAIAKRIAQRNFGQKADFEIAHDASLEGLLQSIALYNPLHPSRSAFCTFLWDKIRSKVLDLHYKHHGFDHRHHDSPSAGGPQTIRRRKRARKKYAFSELDYGPERSNTLADFLSSPPTFVREVDLDLDLNFFLRDLPKRERAMAHLRKKGYTYERIGRCFHLEKSTIVNLFNKSILPHLAPHFGVPPYYQRAGSAKRRAALAKEEGYL